MKLQRVSVVYVLCVLFVPLTLPTAHATTCDLEESPRCRTCEDGLDNDGNDRIDAEDPACATLSEYQRAAIVLTRPGTNTSDEAPAIGSVLLPGALVGEPADGRCDVSQPATTHQQPATGICRCPSESPECQSSGRPCSGDTDCVAVPYPLGRSRAGLCAGADAANDPATRCRPESDLVRIAHSIERLPGEAIDPIRVTKSTTPLALSFGAGRHLVDVDEVALDPGTEMVLTGEADTVIVLRVAGALSVGPQAAVTLSGELAAGRVLWLLRGGEDRVVLAEGSRFVGTLLAPERPVVEVGAAQINGAILAATIEPAGSVQFVNRIDN